MPSTSDIQPCDNAAGEGLGVSVDETLLEGAVVTITSHFAETALVCYDGPRVLRILARTATNRDALARHAGDAPKAGGTRDANPRAMP
jgi:hypothetical protein